MKNRMIDVPKLFGLDLGEVFQIKNSKSPKDCYFRFVNTNLEVSLVGTHDTWITANDSILAGLLKGELNIKKVPWKPTKYDSYYFSCLDYEDLWGYSTWEDTQVDKDRLKHGIVFKTKEEAIDLAQRMLAVAKEAREDG